MIPHVLWFTGLSGSGKSTISQEIKKTYPEYFILDGDILRSGICSDLGFSDSDRKENMRRVKELCKLLISQNISILATFISPFEENRNEIKHYLGNCSIIWCAADLEKCEKRDVKGLYRKARNGIIPNFTGISSPYEVPKNPDLKIETGNVEINICKEEVLKYIRENYGRD